MKRDIPVIVADLDIEKNKGKLEKNIKRIGKDEKLVNFLKLDITDFENIESIFKNNKIDSVINLAYGIGTICEENPLLASKINIVGTTSIFEMIAKVKLNQKYNLYFVHRSNQDLLNSMSLMTYVMLREQGFLPKYLASHNAL